MCVHRDSNQNIQCSRCRSVGVPKFLKFNNLSLPRLHISIEIIQRVHIDYECLRHPKICCLNVITEKKKHNVKKYSCASLPSSDYHSKKNAKEFVCREDAILPRFSHFHSHIASFNFICTYTIRRKNNKENIF